MHRGLAWGITGVVLLGFAGTPVVGVAEEPSLAERARAALNKHRELRYLLPGQQYFQTAEGIKQLDLTKEQLETIQHIGMLFNAKVLDQRQESWKEEGEKLAKMTAEEKQKYFRESNAKRQELVRQWAIEARQQVEKLLDQKQLELLREGEFQKRLQYLVYQPQLLEATGLDDAQKAKIKAIRAETDKKHQEYMQQIVKMQNEASMKMVDLLKPEQRAKLRETLEKLYQQSMQVR